MKGNIHTSVIKRALAIVLSAGMIWTGMPSLNAAADNPRTEEDAQQGTDADDDANKKLDDDADKKQDADADDDTDKKPGADANDDTDKKQDADADNDADKKQGDDADDDIDKKQDDDADQKQDAGADDDADQKQDADKEESAEAGEKVPSADEDIPDAVYDTQVSGNDISGNDLAAVLIADANTAADENRVVGGYIILNADRDVSTVATDAVITDYGDEIASLMSGSVDKNYQTSKLPLTRSQGDYKNCWAHTAMAQAEIDMMNNGGVNDPDYSERHLAYFSYKNTLSGDLAGDINTCDEASDYMNAGGNLGLAQYVLASWVGAASENQVPDTPDTGLAFVDEAHLQNAFQVDLENNRDIAKRMIKKYGSLGTAYYDATENFNSTNSSYYCSSEEPPNHAVAVVGWDDFFSSSNFNTRPSGGSGAWLVRNSWSDGNASGDMGRDTYFWLSYYDQSLISGYAFDFEPANNYNHNYQYDGGMYTRDKEVPSVSNARAANVFTVKPSDTAGKAGEELKAVGLTFPRAQTPYTIRIYKNVKKSTDPENAGGGGVVTDPESGTLVENATTSGTCGCEGFYTIPLKQPVLLSTDEIFSVVVEYGATQQEHNKVYLPLESKITDESSPQFNGCEVNAAQGQSFYQQGNEWRDCADDLEADGTGNLRIKAYTDDANSSKFPSQIALTGEGSKTITAGSTIDVGSGDTYQVTCEVQPDTAADKSVQWESSAPSIASVDKNGTIIGRADGTATITVSCIAKPSVKTSFYVRVASVLKSITITGSASVYAGGTLPLKAAPNPANASLEGISWTSSVPAVATVDNSGIVTGVAPGYTVITAKVNNISATKNITCEFPAIQFTPELSEEGITLKWKKAPGATAYHIYRVEGSEWKESQKQPLSGFTMPSGDDCAYLDKTVRAAESYTYQIEADVTYIKNGGSETKTKKSSTVTVAMPNFYHITYEPNGGTNAAGNPTVFHSSQSDFTLLAPSKTGYDFVGWYTDSACTQPITALSSSTVTADLTLYAKWSPHVYSITYEDGGSHDNPVSYTIESETITLKPAEKEGYRFVAWYSDAECTAKIEKLVPNSLEEYKDITIYAKWNREYSITYVLYGGINNENNKKVYTETDEAITLLEATREDGTVFEGWYSDSQYKTKVTQIQTNAKRDIVLFAKWQGEAAPVVTGIQIKRPARTTYKNGENLDVSGGTITIQSDKNIPPIPMSESMLSGFDSSRSGKESVTVTFEKYTAAFDTLIVEEPELRGFQGQKLSELTLPENDYGIYFWPNEEATLAATGTSCQMPVSFLPDDTDAFQRLDNLSAQITLSPAPAANSLNAAKLTIQTLRSEPLTYTGMAQTPSVILTLKGVPLVENRDYKLSYYYNINAGTASVHATGCGDYAGGIRGEFVIKPAEVRIKAKDKTILIGEQIPAPAEYEWEVNGLLLNDQLSQKPTCSCEITANDTKNAGRFAIVPAGADAGSNYHITYENGVLNVADEYLVHSVTFDVQGHGTAPDVLHNIRAGSTIDEPAEPAEKGYTFKGWCKDATCTKAWDFGTDTVQSNLTLYAKWLKKSAREDSQFQLQEIEDIYYYTGRALKPAVNVYDGDTLLKVNRDYSVKYVNNTNSNAGGVWTKGSGQGADFNSSLPYVQITGKGNYSDVIKMNFDIHPAVISDGKGNPAEKIVLRYTDQYTVSSGILRPFSSIRYIGGMKRDKDFTVSLTPINARDESGQVVSIKNSLAKAEIPKKYSGTFRLTVTGIGNYSGVIHKNVYVTDRLHLMKNARITLGKNQKNVELTGRSVTLTPGEKDSADTFTVKFGKTVLTPNKDYVISYLDNYKVGKATLVITGAGDYAGTKTITFNIKGKPFTSGKIKVTGIEEKVYTGKAITQNGVSLVYNFGSTREPVERELKYGTDYTISYTKNVNKGTATMTFTGLKEAGFSGSFRKSFRISAAPIDDTMRVRREPGWNKIDEKYSKAGVKPDIELTNITNEKEITLQNGKDYTLSYRNNRNVAKPTDEKAPTIIVRGKGNYQGTFSVPFTISKADLRDRIDNGEVTIKISTVAYQKNKAGDYVYKPNVRLMEGRSLLRSELDYTVTYKNNTQAEYEAYIASLANADENTDLSKLEPQAIIRAGSDNTYLMKEELAVPLTIYRNKLTSRNLEVKIPECIYTGAPVKPDEPQLQVRYKTESGWISLTKNVDYTITYGTNVVSGKRGGRITISGKGTLYGGDVTVYFEIKKKSLRY